MDKKLKFRFRPRARLRELLDYTDSYNELSTFIQKRTNWDSEKLRLETRRFVAKGLILGYSVQDLLEFIKFKYQTRLMVLDRTGGINDEQVDALASKDKRYKKGIRIGYPLKTERNYAPIRTDPPHSGPINPESGPRAGGATAPILRVRGNIKQEKQNKGF